MKQNEITSKIRELKNLEALIDQAQKEAEQIKEEIKKEMEVDVFKIRYKTVTTNRFDTTAFKAKYQELYTQYTKPTISKRFTIA